MHKDARFLVLALILFCMFAGERSSGGREMFGKKRKKSENKIGLVLGSGAARGLSHIGVIKAIEKRGLEIHCVAGSSIGALIGACFAKEKSVKSIEALAIDTDWKKMLELVDPNPASILKGLVQGKKIKQLLKRILDDVEFGDLALPLTVMATDLERGESVAIKEGNVADAVRASISMPAIFTPVKKEDVFLIDGGPADPLPVAEARARGANFIIASNVLKAPAGEKISVSSKVSIEERARKEKNFLGKVISALTGMKAGLPANAEKFIDDVNGSLKNGRLTEKELQDAPNIFEVIVQAVHTMEQAVLKERKAAADVLIEPSVSDISLLEFHRAEEAIERGYEAAEEMLKKRFKDRSFS